MHESRLRRPFLSVVVPVLNEEAGLAQLLEAVNPLVSAGCEVIIVDNGSEDNTWQVLAATEGIRPIMHPVRGFGSAIKAGVASANGRYVTWLPGSLRVNPVFALAVALELDRRFPYSTAFAKAHRTGRPVKDRVTSAVAGAVLTARTRSYMMETGGTPTVFPSTVKDTVLAAPDDLGIESFTLWALREKGLRLWRPHVPFGPRVQGESRWNKGLASQLRLMRHLLSTATSYPGLLAQSEVDGCSKPKGGE